VGAHGSSRRAEAPRDLNFDRASVARVVPLVPAWRVDKSFDYSIPEKLAGVVVEGSLVAVRFGNRNVRGVVVELTETVEPADAELEPIQRVVLRDPVAPPPMVALYEWLALRYCVPRGRAFTRAQPPRVRVKVEEPVTGAVRVGDDVLRRYPSSSLIDAIRTGRGGTFCLRTLPGEDRGALYAELCGIASHRGSSIVVVPEIALGSIVLDSLESRLGDVLRLDSSRPDGERSANWMRLARGHRFGAGGRAAVLGPSARLALVIVDECHEPSLKEDRAPRYDARRVAIERARLAGAACILGGATPPIDLAFKTGVELVEPGRAAERERRPVVEVVDRPQDGSVGRALHARIREVLRGGGSVALLVPRRGFAPTLWCGSCRRSLRCPRCEAGLSFDRSPHRVRCGRCGFEAGPPDVCPSCGAADFRYLGAGSERLAEQLNKAFPVARVTRVDPDSGPAPTSEERGPSIYVTTWYGTKPSIRPRASLVGVLDADALLRRPDFRAGENGYQALAAMAEWAGPATEGGRLIVQTSDPTHHAVQAISRADYRFFADRELEMRRELGYPPFSELVKATSAGAAAADVMTDVAETARSAGGRVLGPVPVRVERTGPGAREGLQVLVKCPDAGRVAMGLRGILPLVPRGTILRVDVDPI
jgi:primosomal protein N' (replication factor Y)